MIKKLFLFGTGQISRNYTKMINQLSIKIEGYIDNNSEKWGTCFFNKKVYAPDILAELTEADIVIACLDVQKVTMQLVQMGAGSRIKSIYHVIRMGLEEQGEDDEQCREHRANKSREKRTIIIDNINGTWGGAEDWAHKITFSLSSRGHDAFLIENTAAKAGDGLEKLVKRIEKEGRTLPEVYRELIEWMLKKRPFVLINIWSLEALWAACYIKKKYPEDVQIISAVLNDSLLLYEGQCEWDDYIDLYLCISSRIKNNLIESYDINREKVLYREPFIERKAILKKEYGTDAGIPLKICYPCRLVRNQKRADLLPGLIDKLEKRHINYELNIAGDGPCLGEIEGYAESNNLRSKIKFYGKLPRKALQDFLNEQDIYLNFSEFEGTSLTMLEAMASGCVPVVTNVSGVEDFIVNMENGLISNVGDIDDIAENIAFLDRNRDKLQVFGMKNIDTISSKCKFDDYIDYLEGLINRV